MKSCRLCPRNCGVPRESAGAGVCRSGERMRIARAALQEIFDANSAATGMADAQVEAFQGMVADLVDRFPSGAGYTPGDIL